MATTAEIIARRLYEAGCRHAFGIPGGEVLTMMEALRDAGIAFNLAKHENAAGFMAEGTYHATGAPGILLATVGPGVANAVNVVANAFQDRVPLIVLTGCIDEAQAFSYWSQRRSQSPSASGPARCTSTFPSLWPNRSSSKTAQRSSCNRLPWRRRQGRTWRRRGGSCPRPNARSWWRAWTSCRRARARPSPVSAATSPCH
jgi:hypothetical protein